MARLKILKIQILLTLSKLINRINGKHVCGALTVGALIVLFGFDHAGGIYDAGKHAVYIAEEVFVINNTISDAQTMAAVDTLLMYRDRDFPMLNVSSSDVEWQFDKNALIVYDRGSSRQIREAMARMLELRKTYVKRKSSQDIRVVTLNVPRMGHRTRRQ